MSEAKFSRTLVLIRHAQSARNAVKRGETFFADDETRDRVRGTPDHKTPLSDLGRAQAVQAGAALKKRFGVPGEVIHSGYLRTDETAAGILSAYDDVERAMIKVSPDFRIRERAIGWAYDMTAGEVGKHFPWLKEHFETAGAFFGQPPGGESLMQVVDRLTFFALEFLLGLHQGTTFVVSHGNTIRCLRFLIEDLTYAQVEAMKWPPNCGIVAYAFDADGKPSLIADNEKLWTSST